MSQIKRALLYLFTAITKPTAVFQAITADVDQLEVSLWILVLFALLYSITAFLLYLTGRLPAIEPWMPISPERYYFYQMFRTLPWGLATAIMMAGIVHVMAAVGSRHKKALFEDALAVVSIAWVVPSFIFMWLPETFIAPLALWPVWVDIVRLSVLAPIWQVSLIALGIRISHDTGWVRASLIGVVTTVVSFLMFLPFMR